MDIGVSIRNLGKLPVREAVDYMLGAARAADELGYASVWVADHFFFPVNIQSRYPYNQTGRLMYETQDNVFEPLTVLASLATVTRRVKLGTNVLVLPYRHPLLTAKVLATIDALSNGRVILGTGVGWMREEFDALGAASYEHRGSLTDEYLRIFKEVWTREMPSFEGRWYRFSGFGYAPRPVQKPHIPIWVGGNSEVALRRVARLGDGWQALALPLEGFAQGVKRLREVCAREGRRFEELALSFSISLTIDMNAKGPEAEFVTSPMGSASYVGNPRQLAAVLRRYQQLGARHVASHPLMKGDALSLDTARRAMDLFAKEVMPQLR